MNIKPRKFIYFLSLVFAFSLLLYRASYAQHEHRSSAGATSNKEANYSLQNPGSEKAGVYYLTISEKTVNFTAEAGNTGKAGRPRKAIAVNGQIPGPALYFTEGDSAEIRVKNELSMETSVHWHGLILPNWADGVPYLTTPPIKPGETAIYKFPIVQSGTFWYHSHTMFQEQTGLYGPIIIHKKDEKPMKEYVLLLSDWTDEDPHEIHRKLRTGSDWYLIQKGAVQSYGEALSADKFAVKFRSEAKRMHAMDVSDIYFDAMLANGQKEAYFEDLKPGEKIKVRVINGSSATYFWLQFAGGKITVAANDGKDVAPVEVDRMIIAVAETYDIILSVPDDMSYELRATAEDRTKFTSLWLGKGMKMPAFDLPKLDYFAGMNMMNSMTGMSGNIRRSKHDMSAQSMDMNEVMYPELRFENKKAAMFSAKEHGHDMADMPQDNTNEIKTLNYTMLRSPVSTTLPEAQWKKLHFQLEGNMNRYVWSIDNKVVSETDKILIEKGQNVRVYLRNNTMMRHPMHLHGHYFRVINGQGDFAPLKNVLDIMPGETDIIEFEATERGDWFFHCHILYHMMSGMGRVFSYAGSEPNPGVENPGKDYKKFLSDDKMISPSAHITLASNGISADASLSNTRYELSGQWRSGWDANDYMNAKIKLGRYFGKMQHFFPYLGWNYEYEPDKQDENSNSFTFGMSYLLPMLIVADLGIDTSNKNFILSIKREDIPLTSRLRLGIEIELDSDISARADLRYIFTEYVSFSVNYDSSLNGKAGAGITITY